MADLETMIEKRHPAPGWQVVFEVANGTGYRKETRYADALAMGIWPSHGFAIHGYEIKRSRTDLQKELGDPRKADAIGKYVDYWWLVLDDIKICEGIVIPETWGILAPRGQVLKVHRKAPKRKAAPIDRAFTAAMIRRITEHWVPKHVHDELKNGATEKIRAEVEADVKHAQSSDRRMLESAKREITAFETWSGVKITRSATYDYEADEPHQIRFDYNLKDIGEAVRHVVEARGKMPRYYNSEQTAADVIRREVAEVDREVRRMEETAQRRRGHANLLRMEIERLERECQTSGLPNPDGTCDPAPSDGDDHSRGGSHRGDPGAHEQDAGVQLRDQRAEVPHGEQAPSDPR